MRAVAMFLWSLRKVVVIIASDGCSQCQGDGVYVEVQCTQIYARNNSRVLL